MMLVIRKDQIKALQEAAELAFVDDLIEQLRYEYSVFNGRPLAEQRAMVRNGLQRARQYGIEGKVSLRGFLRFMCDIAPNFDEHPAFSEILQNNDIHPTRKISMIMAEVDEDDIEEAQLMSREDAWLE